MTSIAPPLQAVVALFRGPLQNVRFADIDAAGLSHLAQEVESASADVQALEAKLAEQRQVLSQKQEALLGLAQQALAYARIYAEGDEALSAELNEIALPRATKPRKAASGKAAGERAASPEAEARTEVEAPSAPAAAAVAAPAVAAAPAATAVESSAEEAASSEDAAPAKLGRRKVQRRLARPSAQEDRV